MTASSSAAYLLVIAGLLVAAGGASAEPSSAGDPPGLQSAATLQVSVADVKADGLVPTNYTADGRNLSPPVSWTAGPPQTASYAVVMRDADAPSGGVHWVVYDIPRGLAALPRGIHNLAEPTHPLGVAQGRNDHGSLGYSGPRPAPGDAPHHYRLQVFALDRAPRVRPGAELARVEQAMSGHVVAVGELVMTYPAPSKPPTAGKAPSAASPPPS